MNKNSKKILVVGGPTASGKTDFAIQLAKKINGEIINADSRQIYKFFNIGTNKGDLNHTSEIINISDFEIPKVELEKNVYGWMFDFVDPKINFTLKHFQELSYYLIDYLFTIDKVPILVGGTGLYIDAILKGYILQVSPDSKYRNELEKQNLQDLQQILINNNFDISKLNNSDINNKVRLIRILEKLNTNKIEKLSNKSKYKYDFYYPLFDKEILMKKIESRVEIMFKNGLIDEVNTLLELGYNNTKPMIGIGYKEVVEYLEKRISLQECITKVKNSHKKYAKRQITWFEGQTRAYRLIKIDFEKYM